MDATVESLREEVSALGEKIDKMDVAQKKRWKHEDAKHGCEFMFMLAIALMALSYAWWSVGVSEIPVALAAVLSFVALVAASFPLRKLKKLAR